MKTEIRKEEDFYEKIRLLGEGSFGKAFLVKATKQDKFFVIKQIDLREMDNEEKERTYQEAKILRQLKQPNIIQFEEVYITKKGKLCIVMEYADGGDLQERIKFHKEKNKYILEKVILDWFIQILLAIKHCHE